jgi:hypothetical protein
METNNIIAGENSGLYATTLTNSILIGLNAGKEITSGNGIIIIGDNITSLDKTQQNVVFIGEKMAIGKTIFGFPINLGDVIKKINDNKNQSLGMHTINDTTTGSNSTPLGKNCDCVGYCNANTCVGRRTL